MNTYPASLGRKDVAHWRRVTPARPAAPWPPGGRRRQSPRRTSGRWGPAARTPRCACPGAATGGPNHSGTQLLRFRLLAAGHVSASCNQVSASACGVPGRLRSKTPGSERFRLPHHVPHAAPSRRRPRPAPGGPQPAWPRRSQTPASIVQKQETKTPPHGPSSGGPLADLGQPHLALTLTASATHARSRCGRPERKTLLACARYDAGGPRTAGTSPPTCATQATQKWASARL